MRNYELFNLADKKTHTSLPPKQTVVDIVYFKDYSSRSFL